ncbi:type II secretion system protein M [Psychromonas antarctica]|uniref:type II secretion system protein M n=1 Tax=Psychromonas antarctica TaxID=67573 RepID=UPI001EE8B584|nr:type II secretion system protein M [Psychromonas antarctica]MCG6200091.1 type II secretion system protein M [Psychromonas antarctica]
MNEQFQAWWKSLSEREQQLSSISAVSLLLAIIYWGAWKPLSDQLQASQQELSSAQQTLSWVQDKATLLVQAGVGKQESKGENLSLAQLVNQSAREHGINFSRIVNKKEEIEVWINDVEFTRFVGWLTDLNNNYAVSVLNTDFSKMDQQGHIRINRLLLGY